MNKLLQIPSKAASVYRGSVKGYKADCYLALVYIVGEGRMPAYEDDGWVRVEYKEVLWPLFRSKREGYGSPAKTLLKLNEEYGFLEKKTLWGDKHTFSIFRLTEKGEDFMTSFNTREYNDQKSENIDIRKEKPVSFDYPDRCFQLKDKKGNDATLAAYDLPTAVLIDKELMLDFLDYMNVLVEIRTGKYTGPTIVRNTTLPLDVVQQAFGSPDMSTPEGRKREIARVRKIRQVGHRMLEDASIGGDWKIPQQMEQKPYGRSYAYNGEGFTNTPRCVRKCLLNKYYSFDMDNAQLAILAQLAKDFGEWEHIHYYLDNKSQVRDEMSVELGISVDEFKQAILSTVFGSSDNGKSMRAIMPSSETRARFRELNEGLLLDIRLAKIALVDHARATAVDGVMTNMNGKKEIWDNITVVEKYDYTGKEREATTAEKYRKVASFLLQGAESRLIREVLSIRGYGNKVVTTIHDSFVTIVPIDLNDLQEYLFNRTGLNVSWSAEHIPEKPCASWAKELKEKKVVPMKPTKKEDRKNG